MATKSKKGLGLVIFSLVAVAGVVGYIVWKKYKEKKDGKKDEKTPDGTPDGINQTLTDTNIAPSGFTFPFKTKEEGNNFRAWVIAKDPAYAKSIKLDPTGELNSFLEKAWLKYGEIYTKEGSGTSITQPLTMTDYAQLAKVVIDAKSKTARVVGDKIVVDLLNNYGTVMGAIEFSQGGTFYAKYGSERTAKGIYRSGGKVIGVKNICRPAFLGAGCTDVVVSFSDNNPILAVNKLAGYIKSL